MNTRSAGNKTLPNKVLQRTNADARASRSLWRLQLNAGTLAGEDGASVLEGAVSVLSDD